MKTTPIASKTAPADPLLYSVKAASQKLSVSYWTVLRLIKAGELLGLMIRGRLLVEPDELRAYVKRLRARRFIAKQIRREVL